MTRGFGRACRAAALGGVAALVAACAGPISLKGRVLDDKGTAVRGAQVETDPPTDLVTTTAQGWFVISRITDENGENKPVPPGAYKIRVTMMGFNDVELPVTLEAGEVVLQPVVLQPRTLDLGETAPETLDDKPVDMDSSSIPVNGN